ncbi:hypothetical protein RCH20_000645 [Psychrobacter sp. PL15]|uniref:hypothetical protein n=1 Tax=Psychrobacter sp. PL15 TaxID=3071719 RepID=UPI002E0BB73B|nr:hypothetical protein [Psychrobacter sp. PL15]
MDCFLSVIKVKSNKLVGVLTVTLKGKEPVQRANLSTEPKLEIAVSAATGETTMGVDVVHIDQPSKHLL